MPDLAAAGPISGALVALRALIASLSWFQTWTGHPGDATEAAKHIFIGEVGGRVDSVARASNVITVTTSLPHELSPGDEAHLVDVGENFNGPVTVATTPDEHTFTATQAGADLDATEVPDGYCTPAARPFLVLMEAEGECLSEQSIATNTSILSGGVEILFEADVSSGYQNQRRNARVEALNAIGQFQAALRAADADDWRNLRVENEPNFVPASRQGDNTVLFEWWQAVVRLDWGLEG